MTESEQQLLGDDDDIGKEAGGPIIKLMMAGNPGGYGLADGGPGGGSGNSMILHTSPINKIQNNLHRQIPFPCPRRRRRRPGRTLLILRDLHRQWLEGRSYRSD